VVGLVLVSHSHAVAVGAAELARQMGGDDVPIEIAGGMDLPDHPIGTDAALVARAIERAWSEDGVLVLMDLGSAVLSTELALDLLADVQRDRVMLTSAPIVEGAVAAAVTAKLGEPLERVAAEARGGLQGKQSHLEDAPGPDATPEPVTQGESRSATLTVENPHGLHARPAARLVQTVSAFDAAVRVWNRTAGRGPADGRSLNGVATLGVAAGDRIEIEATGPEADKAIAAILELASRAFDEVPDPGVPPGSAALRPAAATEPEGRRDLAAGSVLRAFAASPGIAIGPARHLQIPELTVPDALADDPGTELARLDAAIDAAREDIEAQRAAVAGAAQAQAAIFDAHLLFLQDAAILDPARYAIAHGRSAPGAWRDAVGAVAATWEALEDEYLRARVDDLRSVGRQVLAHLLGVALPASATAGPGVLVADVLTPADTAGLGESGTVGIVTATGGPTSHAAVLARSLGIPAVVGAGPDVLAIAEGTQLAVDGGAGTVYLAPPAEVMDGLRAAAAEHEERERRAGSRALEPAVTTDGVRIEVAANIGSPAEAAAAVSAGADGVGLFRTELLFMGRPDLPGEDEQEHAYRQAALALDGRPMVVRTLDVGADKPLPALAQPAEANPFLGVRGVRLSLERPDLLDTQLRALIRVAADHPVRIMFPMISTLAELRAARDAVERARAAVGAIERSGPRTEIGIMVEVPAAALMADVLAGEADFFSIGTNDLTQYTLAADRGNERVASLADPLHPSVLRLIARTAEAAQAQRRWVGVCGELAADPVATAVLLGLGVRELSMSAPAIAGVKEAVRATDLGRARAIADRAVELASAEAVRELLTG
jgi:multiphosphoryl transfer protein